MIMLQCIYSVGRRFVNEVLLNGNITFIRVKLIVLTIVENYVTNH